jgi:ribosomal protein S27E
MRFIDSTQAMRSLMLETGDKSRCLGCGNTGTFLGTSRWNARAQLCTKCCLEEALGGRADPFKLANLPGGRGYPKGA